jgi:sulfur-oxidizing protein SoxY
VKKEPDQLETLFRQGTLRRRGFLALSSKALLAGLAAVFIPGSLKATPASVKESIALLTGNAEMEKGLVTVSMPKIYRQPEFVPIRVTVESPMTPDDYVRALHLFAERNPEPGVASFSFTPECTKAEVVTRLRLVESQIVVAVAEMSDGSFYMGKGFSKISTGASSCG